MTLPLFPNSRGRRHRTASWRQRCFLVSIKTRQTSPDVHLIDNGIFFTHQFRVLDVLVFLILLLLIITNYLLNISAACSACYCRSTSSMARELSRSIFIFQGYFKTLVWINLTILWHYFLAWTKITSFKYERLIGTYCCTWSIKRFASAIKKTLQVSFWRNLRLLLLLHIISNHSQRLLLFLAEHS